MKRSTMNLMLAAAAMMVASTVASAQNTVTAEIPFRFQAAGALMPAGSYRVVAAEGETHFFISNWENTISVVLISRAVGDAPKDWVRSGTPKLQFDCGDDGCALASIWTGKASTGAHEFQTPKMKHGGQLGFMRVVSANAQ